MVDADHLRAVAIGVLRTATPVGRCARPAPAPSAPRFGIREKGIGDVGQQATRAGRSVACRRARSAAKG